MKKPKIYQYKVNWIYDFSEGVASFLAYSNEYQMHLMGYVNKALDVIVPPVYAMAKDFKQGLAAVKLGQDWKFINRRGGIAIDVPFADVCDGGFHEGLAAVRAKGGHKYGYIGKNGLFKIKPIFDIAYRFSNGRAVVVFDGNFYLINRHGDFVTKSIGTYTGL